MAVPLLAGLLGFGGVNWIAKNVVGSSDWLNQYFDPKISTAPSQPSNASIAAYSSEQYFFRVQVLAPSDNDIKALDDFFESFGYRVDRMQVPNLKVRNTFTYVKTRDAVVYSSNQQASEQLCAMLNNGCKFWVDKIG